MIVPTFSNTIEFSKSKVKICFSFLISKFQKELHPFSGSLHEITTVPGVAQFLI